MKIVIVLDRDLPRGLQVNAAAVLALSAAPHLPGAVGPALPDRDGGVHLGLTGLPIPILACPGAELPELRRRAQAQPGAACVDFSDVAQRARRYPDYAADLRQRAGAELGYLGLCLFGEPEAIRSLTGNLGLLR